MEMPRSRERKEKKEPAVRLPYIPSMKERSLIEETIEDERARVFSFAKRIGDSISGLMIMIGTLSVLAAAQYLFHLFEFPGLPEVKDLLTPELVVIAAGILGIINMICGFVLLAKK